MNLGIRDAYNQRFFFFMNESRNQTQKRKEAVKVEGGEEDASDALSLQVIFRNRAL